MFKKILKKNRKLYILSLVLKCISVVGGLLFSIQFAYLIDSINKDQSSLYKSFLIATGFVFCNIGALIIYSYTFNKYKSNVLNELKKQLYIKLYDNELSGYDSEKGTSYLSLLTKDTELLLSDYLQPSIEIYSGIFTVIASLYTLAYISIPLTIIFIALSGINIWLSRVPSKYMIKTTNDYTNKNKQYLQYVTKYINGFDQIKLLNLSETFKTKLNHADDDFERNRFSYLFSKDISSYFTASIASFSQLLSFAVGIFFAIKGYITVGLLISSLQILSFVFRPLGTIGNYKNLMKSQTKVIENIDNILQTENKKLADLEGKVEKIKIDELSFKFNENTIFDKFNYEFVTNKNYAIIGRSGRGKSTLIKLIMKYYEKDKYEGNIYVNDSNIDEISSKSLYSKIAYIQKNDFLIDSNGKDNILLERKSDKFDSVVDVLNLGSVLENTSFSLGEKQRIDLARFLINDYDVLIFDEPTSNLDPQLANKVEEYILNIKDKIVIVITHNQDETNLERYDEVISLI